MAGTSESSIATSTSCGSCRWTQRGRTFRRQRQFQAARRGDRFIEGYVCRRRSRLRGVRPWRSCRLGGRGHGCGSRPRCSVRRAECTWHSRRRGRGGTSASPPSRACGGWRGVRRHGRCSSRRCGGARWRIGRAIGGAWARARWPAAGRGGRWRHHEQLARHRDVLITEANRLESAASEPGLRKVTGRVAGGDELRYRSSCRHHFSRSASSLATLSDGVAAAKCDVATGHTTLCELHGRQTRKHHLLCVESPHDMQLVRCTAGVAQITTAVHTSGFEDGQGCQCAEPEPQRLHTTLREGVRCSARFIAQRTHFRLGAFLSGLMPQGAFMKGSICWSPRTDMAAREVEGRCRFNPGNTRPRR